jgi:hypothetical protein
LFDEYALRHITTIIALWFIIIEKGYEKSSFSMLKGFSKEIYGREKKIIEKVIISISVLVLDCCCYNEIHLLFISRPF